MGIGGGLVLIAVGAVLAFATNFDIAGINLNMIGVILMLVGIAGLVMTFAFWRPRKRRAVNEAGELAGRDAPVEHTNPVQERSTRTARKEQPGGPTIKDDSAGPPP